MKTRFIFRILEQEKKNPGCQLTYIWKDEVALEAVIDTFYETDNGMESDEAGYEEYYACALEIIRIIQKSSKESMIKVFGEDKNIGDLCEISDFNCPDIVLGTNGTVIYEKCM